MPAPREYDLSTISATVIVTSDRVLAGERRDSSGPACASRLAAAGLTAIETVVVAEGHRPVATAIRAALARGDRFVIVLGGSGFGPGNEAPEVVRSVIAVEIPGIAEQIRAHGLAHTLLSPLSREVAGITARDAAGALVVASPGSTGGMNDTLDVLIPLLGSIYAQLAER